MARRAAISADFSHFLKVNLLKSVSSLKYSGSREGDLQKSVLVKLSECFLFDSGSMLTALGFCWGAGVRVLANRIARQKILASTCFCSVFYALSRPFLSNTLTPLLLILLLLSSTPPPRTPSHAHSEPWEVVGCGIAGAYVGYRYNDWEAQLLAAVNEQRAERDMPPITGKL